MEQKKNINTASKLSQGPGPDDGCLYWIMWIGWVGVCVRGAQAIGERKAKQFNSSACCLLLLLLLGDVGERKRENTTT